MLVLKRLFFCRSRGNEVLINFLLPIAGLLVRASSRRLLPF